MHRCMCAWVLCVHVWDGGKGKTRGYHLDAVPVQPTYPPRHQQSCAVGSSIVSQSNLDSILWQLMRISRRHDVISFKFSICNLQTNTTNTGYIKTQYEEEVTEQ